jgi:hypothetical protein
MLTRIEGKTFSCSSLKSVHLPASLQFLHHKAFPWAKVFEITIEEGNRHFRVWGDFLIDIDGVRVVRYFGHDRTVTLRDEIETLGVGCFFWCPRLWSLVFERGSKLKRIEALALSDCSELKSICIPVSVEILCAGCFSRCRSLSSLTFEADSRLTEIEANVFNDCSDLVSLSIPASVKIINGSAFASSGISEIAIEEGNANLGFSGTFLINVTATSVVRHFGWDDNITLDSKFERLCAECFSPSSFIFEPGSKLSRIESGAFAHSELESISIPASVESLGDGCFGSCDSLSSVTFGSESKLLRIESHAFGGCSALKSISIPASVESLGEDCLSCCSRLSSVAFDSGSQLLRIEAHAFHECSPLKSFSIPASVQSLGCGCFSACQ